MNAELVGSQDKLMRVRNEYLDLMQAFLTGSIYRDFAQAPFGSNLFDSHRREHGLDWPSTAETMIGVKRLANLRALTESVIADNVPGDLIETGVWRGGACIFMRAILYANSVSDKSVWVADLFEGLPATRFNTQRMLGPIFILIANWRCLWRKSKKTSVLTGY